MYGPGRLMKKIASFGTSLAMFYGLNIEEATMVIGKLFVFRL
jgi:hypothetical protein